MFNKKLTWFLIWPDELNKGKLKIVNEITNTVIVRNVATREMADYIISRKHDNEIYTMASEETQGGERREKVKERLNGIENKTGGKIMIKKKVTSKAADVIEEIEDVTDVVSEKPKAKAKPEEKKKPKTAGESKRLPGKTTGLGVSQAWFHIFEKNEKSRPKLSDAAIGKWMKAEFPKASTDFAKYVGLVRGRYNKGLLGKVVKPSVELEK